MMHLQEPRLSVRDLPCTLSLGCSAEYLFRASADVRVAITGRPGVHGSWKVAYAVATQEYATGFRTWAEGLRTADDADVEAGELLDALVRQGWDELTGQVRS